MDTLKRLIEILGVTLPAGQKSPLALPIDRVALAKTFADLDLNVGAEVGVEQGIYADLLLTANPNLTLYAIDAWQHYRGYRDHVNQTKLDGFEQTTRQRLAPHKHGEVIKGFSAEVVRDFPEGSLDFVYLDANHAFDFIMEDLIHWGRRVRRGGIIAGHDFIRQSHVWVVQAVHLYAYGHGIETWFTTTEPPTGETRSFVLVKP